MDEDTDVPVASGWQYVSPIKHGFTERREVIDWSWCAFRPAYGYPILAEIFGQRLVFASAAAQPQSLWMSKTDDLNNFDTGTQDDSALALTLSAISQNGICWLMAHSFRLLLGTADAEYLISSSNAASLTHATVRVENHGYVGSAPVPAIMAVDKVLYCERGGGRLYQYGYDFQSDSYVSRDLTVFADHILAQGGGVTGGAILRKPEARAVFTLKDGTLALMTYNSMHEVHCWHALEKNNPCFKERHVESSKPGELLYQDTTMTGRLAGMGKIYVQTVVDAYCSYGLRMCISANYRLTRQLFCITRFFPSIAERIWM